MSPLWLSNTHVSLLWPWRIYAPVFPAVPRRRTCSCGHSPPYSWSPGQGYTTGAEAGQNKDEHYKVENKGGFHCRWWFLARGVVFYLFYELDMCDLLILRAFSLPFKLSDVIREIVIGFLFTGLLAVTIPVIV